jgi:hypothetical protein
MEFVSNMLGIGTPKATPKNHDFTSGSQSESSSTNVSKAFSVTHSLIGSVHSLSQKLAIVAKKVIKARKEARAKEEAEAILAEELPRKKEWDEKKGDVKEKARQRDAKNIPRFLDPIHNESPRDPTDNDLVKLQLLETERRIAKLQKDQVEELAKGSMKLLDGAARGFPKKEKTHRLFHFFLEEN